MALVSLPADSSSKMMSVIWESVSLQKLKNDADSVLRSVAEALSKGCAAGVMACQQQ